MIPLNSVSCGRVRKEKLSVYFPSSVAPNPFLAQLKLEAQEALEKQERENTPDQRAQQLLQEFNRGEHDPDKAELEALEELERMEEEDAKKKKKKSWWKFW